MAENVKVIFEGVDKFSGPVKGMAGALGGFAGGVASIATGLGVFKAVGAVAGFAKSSFIDLNSTLQQSKIAFTTMLGSTEAAQTHLDALADFAATTPFEFPELIDASKRLQAYGFEAEQIIPLLGGVSDVASGTGASVDTITLALGQMRVRGKASLGDLNQLAGAGVPIYDALAKTLGVTVAEAQDLVTRGQVDMNEVMAAFNSVAEDNAGAAEAQSKSWVGAMSTINDVLGMTMATSFKPFFDMMTKGAVVLGQFLGGKGFQGFAAQAAEAGVALSTILVDGINAAIDGFRAVADVVGDAVSIVSNMRDAIGGDVVAMADVVGAAMRLFGDGFARNLERVTGAVGDFLAYLRPGNTVDLMRAWFGPGIGPRIDEIVRSFKDLTTGVRLAFDDLRALVSGDMDLSQFWDFLKIDARIILAALGSIAGTLTTWAGDQIAAIDWTAAWGRARATGQGLIDGLGTITADVEAWVRGQFAGVSWAGVWGTVTGVGAGIVAGLGSVTDSIQTWVGEQFAGVSWEGVWGAVPSFDLPDIDTAPMVEAMAALAPAVDAVAVPMERLRDAVSPAASGLASFGEQAGILAVVDWTAMTSNVGALSASITDIGVNGPAATQALIDLGPAVTEMNRAATPIPGTGIAALDEALAGIDPVVAAAVIPALAKLPPQLLLVGLAAAGLAIAWKSDFLGIQTTVTTFVDNLAVKFPELSTAMDGVRGKIGELVATITGELPKTGPPVSGMGLAFATADAEISLANTGISTSTAATALVIDENAKLIAEDFAAMATSALGDLGELADFMGDEYPRTMEAMRLVTSIAMPAIAMEIDTRTKTISTAFGLVVDGIKLIIKTTDDFILFWPGAWQSAADAVADPVGTIKSLLSGLVAAIDSAADAMQRLIGLAADMPGVPGGGGGGGGGGFGAEAVEVIKKTIGKELTSAPFMAMGTVAGKGFAAGVVREAKTIAQQITPAGFVAMGTAVGASFADGIAAEANTVETAMGGLLGEARAAFQLYIDTIILAGKMQGDWLVNLSSIPLALRDIAGEFGRYIAGIVEDGDAVNAWLASLPPAIRDVIGQMGQHLASDTGIQEWAQQAGLAFGYIEEKLAGFGAAVPVALVPATEALMGFADQATSATTAAAASIEANVGSLDAALVALAETTLPSLMGIYNTTQRSMDAATYEAVSSMIAGLQDLAAQGVVTFGEEFPTVFRNFYDQTLAQLETLYRAAMGNMDTYTVDAVSAMIAEVQKFAEQADQTFAAGVPDAMAVATDAADLANAGISGAVDSLSGSVEDRFEAILRSIEDFVKRVLALLASIPTNVTTTHTIVTNTVQGETYTQTTEPVATYAMGGVVPGPIGAPRLAVVHGGEEVLTPGQRGGRGVVNFSPQITIHAALIMTKDDLIRELNEGLRDFIRSNPEYNLAGAVQP